MFAVFMLSSTHSKLKESQESNDKCQQQRDSLSAQLQVVYEHKSRLEKTLQNEIADRKRAEDGTRLLRDQSEKDRADARDKIKSLEQQLSESQVAQAEEFKNLKASYGALDQEKEKINAELASHVTLLQQEREAKLKLARQLEELQQSRRSDTQVAVGLQKQLETCRAETSQLYFKLQQQNLVAPQQQIGGVVNGKPGASADLLAGNEGKLQPGAQAELKPNAKLPTRSERFAAGSNLRQQVAAPLLRPPPQLSAPQWGAAQLHRPHMAPPHVVQAARFEPPHNAVAHFDPHIQDPVRAYLHASRHSQPQGQHQEEYQLVPPNLNAHDGGHAAMHQAVMAAADGWRREH